MTLIALVVVVLAVTAALVYNRIVWRPRQASGRASDDGLSIAGIIGPLGTLSVLLSRTPGRGIACAPMSSETRQASSSRSGPPCNAGA